LFAFRTDKKGYKNTSFILTIFLKTKVLKCLTINHDCQSCGDYQKVMMSEYALILAVIS